MFQKVFGEPPNELAIPIRLSDPSGQNSVDAIALIDTGATSCCITTTLVRQLELYQYRIGYTDVAVPGRSPLRNLLVFNCLVDVEGVGDQPIAVRAIEFPVSQFVLGMNWCNQVEIHYRPDPNGSGSLLEIDLPKPLV